MHATVSGMPKISVSVPGELLVYLDSQGCNRSQFIVSILNEHRARQSQADLQQAYTQYAQFCAEEDGDWWPEWETAAVRDQHDG